MHYSTRLEFLIQIQDHLCAQSKFWLVRHKTRLCCVQLLLAKCPARPLLTSVVASTLLMSPIASLRSKAAISSSRLAGPYRAAGRQLLAVSCCMPGYVYGTQIRTQVSTAAASQVLACMHCCDGGGCDVGCCPRGTRQACAESYLVLIIIVVCCCWFPLLCAFCLCKCAFCLCKCAVQLYSI